MPHSLVEYQSENHIATITMNDPKTLNAFSTPLKNAMMEALNRADEDADIRVIVL
ncbi:MAG: enoyl-CoA hydratase, partial [Psychrobacter sp.]|nr:enoyl-CoA hydratase [Psychrobacter sp.]